MSTPAWLDARMSVPATIYGRVPAGVDEYGDVVYDDVARSTRVFLTPASQSEIQNGRALEGGFVAYLPASDLVGFEDGFARMEVTGVSYEMSGPPAIFTDLDSSPHHAEAYLLRSTA